VSERTEPEPASPSLPFAALLRRRRMVRAFQPGRPVAADALERILDAGRRAPSAGHAQGLDLVVLTGAAETGSYWARTFPEPGRRARFAWPGLFDAPVLVVPVVSVAAYTARYGEADKAALGLGSEAAWGVPYWWVDGGMAVALLLLAALDEGLGACFFGLFDHEAAVLADLGVPPGRRALGTVAVGHPAPDRPGASATRPRRPLEEVVHRGRW
jgi:nitroreductase